MNAIEALTQTHRQENQDRLLKLTEVADLFQISRSTTYRLLKEQGWPHIRFGTEIRFSQENIDAIKANANRRSPRIGTRAERAGARGKKNQH